MRAPAAVVAALVALACALPAAAADAPPAVAAFATAWAAVDNYTTTITVHETDGKNVQDRVYHYAYKKPTFAKIDVVSGPGKGSGAVWTGGDRVRGHMGGFLSGIKQSIAITDSRATSLRGDTIEKGSFQSVADDFKNGKVDPSAADATVDGVATDAVTVGLTPAAPGGATREVVYLSRATHLPVRRMAYAGDALVKQEDFSDVKLNPGLTEGDFN
jgi:outer membrane lipoprotein-sorting protein